MIPVKYYYRMIALVLALCALLLCVRCANGWTPPWEKQAHRDCWQISKKSQNQLLESKRFQVAVDARIQEQRRQRAAVLRALIPPVDRLTALLTPVLALCPALSRTLREKARRALRAALKAFLKPPDPTPPAA